METRRSFLVKGSMAIAAMSLPFAGCTTIKSRSFSEPASLDRALVVWNSQTGNTERVGETIAKALTAVGVEVEGRNYRDVDADALARADLLVVGTPVHYFDIPANMKAWLRGLPSLEGRAVAAYVTFGGAGHNQHNTACRLAEALVSKGAVPVGLAAFGNMSTYAITWSTGREARTLNYAHLPDQSSCEAMKSFARDTKTQTLTGESIGIDTEFFAWDFLRGSLSMKGAKLLASGHSVDRDLCIGCGACETVCPTGAIHPEDGSVETDRCLFCLGCINNCPQGAVTMRYAGKEVYGLPKFMDMHDLPAFGCG